MGGERAPPAADAPELLRAWLESQGKTAYGFAVELEVTAETLSRWMRRRVQIPKVAALAIELLTGGAVPHARWGTLVTKKETRP